MAKHCWTILAAILLMGAAHQASAAAIGYYYSESPEANNRQSARYDYLLSISSSFRHYRMRKECSPIDNAPLRGDCIGSFDTYEPIAAGYR